MSRTVAETLRLIENAHNLLSIRTSVPSMEPAETRCYSSRMLVGVIMSAAASLLDEFPEVQR